MTYFTSGKWIVEVQQEGEKRAKYGNKGLITLSDVLNKEFGKGFSAATLTNIRKFFLTYQDRISEPEVTNFTDKKSQQLVTISSDKPPFYLSWTHYLILVRIDNKDERDFYEMQAMKEGWGKRELKRQYGSSIIMVLPVKQMKQILRRMCWFWSGR
jgi:hypothetical protein